MKQPSKLADLPLLPRDEAGPVFAEPWQAQVFAVVVGLTQAGKVSHQEWADRLGAVLKEAEVRGETDTGRRYYEHWLTALERLVVEKSLAGLDELAHEGEAIREDDHHRREDQLHGSPRHSHP
jgi:nitrile hydratase accessory protein